MKQHHVFKFYNRHVSPHSHRVMCLFTALYDCPSQSCQFQLFFQFILSLTYLHFLHILLCNIWTFLHHIPNKIQSEKANLNVGLSKIMLMLENQMLILDKIPQEQKWKSNLKIPRPALSLSQFWLDRNRTPLPTEPVTETEQIWAEQLSSQNYKIIWE